MTEVGAEVRDSAGEWRPLVALALETYTRNPAGKHRVLDIMAGQGIPLPDTPPMAVHRVGSICWTSIGAAIASY